MDQATIVRTLENDNHRGIIYNIIEILESHHLSVGEAKNVLEAAAYAVNFTPVASTPLTDASSLWETTPAGRSTHNRSVTDILLRDVPDVS